MAMHESGQMYLKAIYVLLQKNDRGRQKEKAPGRYQRQIKNKALSPRMTD